LRKAVPGAEVQAAEIQRLQRVLCKERVDKAALRRLLDETVGLYAGTRRLRDQQDRVVSLSDEVGRLRYGLQRSEAMKDRLKVRLLRRAESARAKSPAAADEALRKALGRSRRRKAALGRLRKENARLRRTVQAWRRRVETQETELAKLRATRAVLSKALHGRKSEQRERPGTGRPRGQRRGAPGHGRTPRCGLEERVEERRPPAAARTCSGCGKPYAAVGVEESALVEIEVRAHRRVILVFRVTDRQGVGPEDPLHGWLTTSDVCFRHSPHPRLMATPCHRTAMPSRPRPALHRKGVGTAARSSWVAAVECQQLAEGLFVGDVGGPTVRGGNGGVKGVVCIGEPLRPDVVEVYRQTGDSPIPTSGRRQVPAS